ncbi:MAG: hypothetical protein GVY29_04520 [Spirochaetes bacterium]|nr:hypothetical protein [Spirochaetota bacterium]
MFNLPEINRRNLLIVAAATLGITIVTVTILLIVAGGGEAPAPPFDYASAADSSNAAAAAAGARQPGELDVADLMLPPEDERVRDWSWRPHVPIGRAWPRKEIEKYWVEPTEIVEERLEDMNESLIQSILGVRE